MPTTLLPPAPNYPPAHLHRSRARHRRTVMVVLAVLCLVVAVVALAVLRWRAGADARRDYLAAGGWPAHGQAAVQVDDQAPVAGPGQHSAPIASLAKVMTAYLVLQAHPLDEGDNGFTLHITADDVETTARERDQDQSVVQVHIGEELSERDALMAVLLPSANNVAEFLARRVAGTVAAFVATMNRTAHRFGMTRTRYVDPSGYDPRTVSTALDQVRLAAVVAGNRTLSAMVEHTSYRLPTGTVHNTDVLLGHDGFIGTKTGSHDAAGGCFMFRARRVVDGHTLDVVGVVMGQPGTNLVLTGQYAARQLLDAKLGPYRSRSAGSR